MHRPGMARGFLLMPWQELSREVDDVLFLLRERISEKTPEGLLR